MVDFLIMELYEDGLIHAAEAMDEYFDHELEIDEDEEEILYDTEPSLENNLWFQEELTPDLIRSILNELYPAEFKAIRKMCDLDLMKIATESIVYKNKILKRYKNAKSTVTRKRKGREMATSFDNTINNNHDLSAYAG